jgi:hypothetical protein
MLAVYVNLPRPSLGVAVAQLLLRGLALISSRAGARRILSTLRVQNVCHRCWLLYSMHQHQHHWWSGPEPVSTLWPQPSLWPGWRGIPLAVISTLEAYLGFARTARMPLRRFSFVFCAHVGATAYSDDRGGAGTCSPMTLGLCRRCRSSWVVGGPRGCQVAVLGGSRGITVRRAVYA